MDFYDALRKLVNKYWGESTHPAMTAALLAAHSAIDQAHAADQGHAYNVFPDEDDPNYGSPMGGPSDNDGA